MAGINVQQDFDKKKLTRTSTERLLKLVVTALGEEKEFIEEILAKRDAKRTPVVAASKKAAAANKEAKAEEKKVVLEKAAAAKAEKKAAAEKAKAEKKAAAEKAKAEKKVAAEKAKAEKKATKVKAVKPTTEQLAESVAEGKLHKDESCKFTPQKGGEQLTGKVAGIMQDKRVNLAYYRIMVDKTTYHKRIGSTDVIFE